MWQISFQPLCGRPYFVHEVQGQDGNPNNTGPECERWSEPQWMVYSSRRSFQKRKTSSESSSLSEFSYRSSSSEKKMAAREEEALPGQKTGQTPGTGQMSSLKPVPSSVTVQTAGPGSVLDQKPTYREAFTVLLEEALPGQRTGTPGTGQKFDRSGDRSEDRYRYDRYRYRSDV